MTASASSSPAAKREGVLAETERKLYMPYPAEGHSYWITHGYVGPTGLERYEIRTLQIQDDVYQDAMIRRSPDNGRSWSKFVLHPERQLRKKGRFTREPFIMPAFYDPQSQRMVRTILMRTHVGDPIASGLTTFHDHALWQTSVDQGHSWGEAQLLRYERGADYHPEKFDDPDYIAHNLAYNGYNMIALKHGGMTVGATIPVDITNEEGQKERVGGVVCFTGQWDSRNNTYHWNCSQPMIVTRRISDRGLMEPWVVELNNGNLFMDMRGNATPANPGRNFYTLSKDGGRTWSEVRDLRYDDGESFYAPSSMSSLFRHSQNHKLYWFGNISPKPTADNSPRHPLYLAEVDEDKPALKRSTLTILDDYEPGRDTPGVQFSNFSIIENRATHDFEMVTTIMGEFPNVYTANAYYYTIRLR